MFGLIENIKQGRKMKKRKRKENINFLFFYFLVEKKTKEKI